MSEDHLDEIRAIVLKTAKPGVYEGLLANDIGKKCVNAWLYHLKVLLRRFSALEIVKGAYSLFDERSYKTKRRLERERARERTKLNILEFNSLLYEKGESFEFLTEAGLVYGGRYGIPSPDDWESIWCLSENIVFCAHQLDLFYYSSSCFPDFKLEITREGDLDHRQDPGLAKIRNALSRKFLLEDSVWEEGNVLSEYTANKYSAFKSNEGGGRDALYARYSPLDGSFESRFGYRFTDSLRFLLGLYDLFLTKSPYSIIVLQRKKLLRKLSKRTGFSPEKTKMLLQNFEMTRDCVMNEGFPNWRFRRKSSLRWRPIVSVSLGSRSLFCVVGKETSVDSVINLTELSSPSDFGKAAERLRQKETSSFEDDTADALTFFGFKVRKRFESPVGEIDVVAILRHLILIVDSKKPIFKSDLRDFLHDMDEAQEWEEKLERKVEWARRNKGALYEQIMGEKAEVSSLSVEGVIVTYRPFYPLNWKFDILFRYEFVDWLEKLNWARSLKA